MISARAGTVRHKTKTVKKKAAANFIAFLLEIIFRKPVPQPVKVIYIESGAEVHGFRRPIRRCFLNGNKCA
jgi:hypothetical protein